MIPHFDLTTPIMPTTHPAWSSVQCNSQCISINGYKWSNQLVQVIKEYQGRGGMDCHQLCDPTVSIDTL